MTKTKVTYQGKYCKDNKIISRKIEMIFVEWNNKYLVVLYPAGNGPASRTPWEIPYSVLGTMIRKGVLKIDGYIPEPALKEMERDA